VDLLQYWLLVLGFFHLVLFVMGLFFFMPKNFFKTTFTEYSTLFTTHLAYLILIVGVAAIHLIEVNILDSYFTHLVGIDFAESIQVIEGDVVYWFSQNWTPTLVYFFVFIYIIVYPFTLWFSPLYFIVTDDKQAMKTLAYGLVFIYAIALPFYLFFPVTNVYTFYGTQSPLETVIPSIENFFYSITTHNNCFPSLHVAVTLLIAKSVSMTKNKKYTYFAYFCAVSVILSVIYLAIHWITDVLCGILLAFGVFYLQKKFIQEK